MRTSIILILLVTTPVIHAEKGDLCAGSNQTPCVSSLNCFTPRDQCLLEIDGTTVCNGVCDTTTTLSSLDYKLGDDPYVVCQDICNNLAQNAQLPGRQTACKQGCVSAGLLALQGLSTCSDACFSSSLWPNECKASCSRLVEIAKDVQVSTTPRPPQCSDFNDNCDKCASASGCSYCRGSFLTSSGMQEWSQCWDISSGVDEVSALCEEDQGSFITDKDKCVVESTTTTSPPKSGCGNFDSNCEECTAQSGCSFCYSASSSSSWSKCFASSDTDSVRACEEEASLTTDTEQCPVPDPCADVTCQPPSCASDETLVIGAKPDGKCCPEYSCQPTGCRVHDNDCGTCSDASGCTFCRGTWVDITGTEHTWSRCYASTDAADMCEEELGSLISSKDKCDANPGCPTAPCEKPTCESGEVLNTIPSSEEGCCPTYQCVALSDFCTDGKLDSDDSSCQCADNCFKCAAVKLFDSVATGQCIRCFNAKALSIEGKCIETSECDTTTYALAGENDRDRLCVKPFTCARGKTQEGYNCQCPTGCIECNFLTGEEEVKCTSCESNRYFTDDRCPRQARCRKSKIEGSPTGEACECPLQDCKVCLLHKTNGVLRCDTCDNEKYNSGGKCIDSCDVGEVAYGDRPGGRFCAPPFSCLKGTIKERNHPFDGDDCKMPQTTCNKAQYDVDRLYCLRCRDAAYLHEGECHATCPSNMAHYGFKDFRRECRQPFVCDKGRSSLDGERCSCGVRSCKMCRYDANNEPGKRVCHQCERKTYLHENQCLSSCPDGFQENQENWTCDLE